MQDPAQQDPLEISREARLLAHRLKESLKANDDLEKDIEFQRKNLRKQYLKLLLLHPDLKESKDAETNLWMQTSYQFISSYKSRIQALDQKLFSPSTHAKGQSWQDKNKGGPVEYRKLLARFRQFLAEEEKFYVQLLIRFRTQFDLKDTHEALVRAGVITTDEPRKPESSRNIFPEEKLTPPMSDSEYHSRLNTFVKLLVCLGDITRYREQYNDGRGRPRAGHEYDPVKPAGRKGKKGAQENLRPRNYSRAQAMYEQARLLVPDDGNASHQLAILAAYQKDSFGALLNYYRALCVRQPYDTATNNLNTVLRKALEQFRAARKVDQKSEEIRRTPKFRVDRFKEWVVVLHALCYVDPDSAAAHASKMAGTIVSEFKSMISDRVLPSNLICETVILALGALWKISMIRDRQVRADRKVIEPLMAAHILDLARSMLRVSIGQLAESLEDVQDKDDLAQRITAPFRRILPAIRICSKWLRSNYGFLETALSSAATTDSFMNSLKAFWEAYASFFTELNATFPQVKLPELTGSLEEDAYMSGFTPIKKVFLHPVGPTEDGILSSQSLVHPNEEYLMRLSDLLNDFHLLKDAEKLPITEREGRFIFDCNLTSDVSATKSPPTETLADILETHPDPPRVPRDNDDDNTTQTSRTEDDVIREAFNTALGASDPVAEEEEEDDEIVWSPPRFPLSPQQVAQTLHSSPRLATPVHAPLTRSPPQQFTPGIPVSTTAQDLLNNVLGFTRVAGDGSEATSSSAPQASMLFGSGTLSAPTQSIWTDAGLRSAPKHNIVPQKAFNNSYIGQERRQSLSHMKTPSANNALLPGSPSLTTFANVAHQQYMHQGVSAPDLFHLHSMELQRDIRPLHAGGLAGQAFDERHYGPQLIPGELQNRHAATLQTYPAPMAPVQRAWNT